MDKGRKLFSLFQNLRTVTLTQKDLTSKEMSQTIKTFGFLDLETTGLPQEEHNRTKITELSLIMVQADHIELGVFPRVLNKLNLCFNPNKQIAPSASRITGLHNDLLEHQSEFTGETVSVINNFLNMNMKPICLVSHNGNRFDFPILRAEIANAKSSLPDDVCCLDFLVAFKELENQRMHKEEVEKKEHAPLEFDDGYDEILTKACEELEQSMTNQISDKVTNLQQNNETTPKKPTSLAAHNQLKRDWTKAGSTLGSTASPSRQNLFSATKSDKNGQRLSYQLQEIFKRLTKRKPTNEHEAEGDVLMLLNCAATLAEKFVEYANKNAKRFKDVPMMRPGVPIGS